MSEHSSHRVVAACSSGTPATATAPSEADDVAGVKVAGVDLAVGCVDLDDMETCADGLSRQEMSVLPMSHDNTYDADFVAAANGVFEGDHVHVRARPFEVAGPVFDRERSSPRPTR